MVTGTTANRKPSLIGRGGSSPLPSSKRVEVVHYIGHLSRSANDIAISACNRLVTQWSVEQQKDRPRMSQKQKRVTCRLCLGHIEKGRHPDPVVRRGY